MFDINKVLELEISFCASFTNKVETDYGRIYYNIDNPLSHDSNHAHIFNIYENPDLVITGIIEFYKSHMLKPRIYNSFIDHELVVLRPHLESQGFTITTYNNTFMRFISKPKTHSDTASVIRRISCMSEDIIELIHSDGDGDWGINVLRNHFHDKRFHLLGLFNIEKCLSIASVKIMDGYSRIDDVKTHLKYRGQRFGTKLINYLVSYHAGISDNHLYLYADNPIAIAMYENIGFRKIAFEKPWWAAYIG